MNKNDKAEEFRKRTKLFALRVLKLVQSLSKTQETQIICKQLFRSVCSVASNYRVVCRARSDAEFYSKISIVVEESDESVFWLELLVEGGFIQQNKINELLKEANEILSIVSASRKTLRIRKYLNN